jgi:hypothetical protein
VIRGATRTFRYGYNEGAADWRAFRLLDDGSLEPAG